MPAKHDQERQRDVGADFDVSQLRFDRDSSDRFVYTRCFVPLAPAKLDPGDFTHGPGKQRGSTYPSPRVGSTLLEEDSALAQALGSIASQFGLLFLDRTRIKPLNAVLGEELLSLSLAPGEQVTIEQKSFSQRETTFEQQDEQSSETDLELESTLSTGLEQTLGHQMSEASSTSFGLSGSIKLPPIEGVEVSLNPSFSHSVNDANSSSSSTAVKRTTQTSQKIASKFRSVHKTTMRVSTQQQFTSSSQRILRNPNAFTPIDLRYYKIYQQLELSHERYGVRVAWAPTVMRPGADVLARASAAYQAVIDEAIEAVTLPEVPTPPPAAQSRSQASDSQIVSNRGLFAFEGESNDYTLHIEPPQGEGWAWDGSLAYIESHLRINIINQPDDEPYIAVVSAWMESSGAVAVTVHVGWSGGGEVSIQAEGRFVQSNSAQQQAYEKEYAIYQAQKATLTAQAKAAAQEEAQKARAQVLEGCEPIAETLRQVVASDIPNSLRSSVAEMELWRSLFDWDEASLSLFPGWWGGQLPDPQSPPDAFVNAAAARLYLPVRPGLETAAAQLVAQAAAQAEGIPVQLAQIERLIEEVNEFRVEHFGGEDELSLGKAEKKECKPVQDRFICLGTWDELLPTEGTHLEVVQASTSAADDLNELRLQEDAARRESETALLHGEHALQHAVEQGVSGAPIQVSLGMNSSERIGSHSERTDTRDPQPPGA